MYQNIPRLYISMDHIFHMNMLQTNTNLKHHVKKVILFEVDHLSLMRVDQILEITSIGEVHHDEKGCVYLKMRSDFHNVFIVQLLVSFRFLQSLLILLWIILDSINIDLLDSTELLGLGVICLIDSPKTTTSNDRYNLIRLVLGLKLLVHSPVFLLHHPLELHCLVDIFNCPTRLGLSIAE